ncbi:Type IV fimbrial assembly protein PilC [hydrothermal vent metagenome]|uniref:Type IV fimbrial assembly protein PilC n=1 Tax=hydrothermal vent metagenome TaxID=652676 RepID=A0A3B1DH48_9ZZZZ
MSTFVYTAKKSTAETVSGQITAESEEEAIELINQLGFLPVNVQERVSNEGSRGKKPLSAENLKIGKRVKGKELFLFSRQLASLLKSGVSILRALTIIAQQTQNPFFKQVILQIASEVRNGKTFSDCLSAFPNIFSLLYITMIRAGEESGDPQDMLMDIAAYQRRQEEILSKVRTALAYPLLMAVVGIATVWFILAFVVPKMAGLFDSLGDALPLPTQILLKISAFLSQEWIWVALVILVCVFSFQRFIKTKKGKALISHFILSLPIFGPIILKTELARFCRTLVLLLKSGVSIIRALPIVTPILSNEFIKNHLRKCHKDLMGGRSFGDSIKDSEGIPAMMGHLITIGEESGNLNAVLGEIAQDYEQETDEQIKIMTTLLEPVMILTIGLVVGFIVFAILLPIFQMDVLG